MVIFKNNLIRMFKSKTRLFIIFLLPILFGFLFAYEGNNISVNLCMIDYDQTVLTSGLYDHLAQQNNMIKADEDSLKNLMINGNIDYALIIDKGFTERLLEGKEVQLKEKYFIQSGKIIPMKIYIQNYVENIKRIAMTMDSEEEVYRILNNVGSGSFVFKENLVKEVSTDKTVGQISFMIQFMLYMSVITTSFLLIDREKNTFVRIISSPVSRRRYIIENLLSYITVSSLQVIISLSFMKYIRNLYFGHYFWLVLLLSLIFGVCIITFGMVVVTTIKSELGSYWTILVITTPLVMLGGCYFELASMPDWVNKISDFIPTKWIMEGTKALIVNNDVSSIGKYFIVLLTFSLTFFIISIMSVKNMDRT